jgi:polyhydroxyalkanoate synthesis regulator phasin
MMDIKEFLDKSMSFGLGLAAYSREKIEDLVEELVKRGEVAQKDARQFAGDLVKKGEEQRVELKKLVHDEVTTLLDKMDLIRKSEVDDKIQSALKQAGLGNDAGAACCAGECGQPGPAVSEPGKTE